MLRFTSEYQRNQRLGLLGLGLQSIHRQLALVLLAAGGLVFLALAPWTGGAWAAIVGLGIVFGVASGANASVTSLLNGLRERRIVALHQGADPWLRLGLALIVLQLLGDEVFVFLAITY